FVDMEREEETKDPEDCYRFRIGEEDRKNENGVTEFWKLVGEKDQKYENKRDSRKLRKEKNVPERVSPFAIVPGQVVKGA
ncbi:19105_t:CDS:2, partial [Gigaspora rosea]